MGSKFNCSAKVTLIALVGLVAVLLGWQFLVRGNLQPRRFGVVEEGRIYRSGKFTPAAFDRVVREHGIRTVVDLGAWPIGSREDRRAQRSADALGVTRVRLNLEGDATGDPNDYVTALRLMNDRAGQPVLVHCGAGTQRTGCAVILQRHFIEGMPLDAAFAEAGRFDHDPKENPKLRAMIERYGAAIARAYRDGGRVSAGETASAAGAGE